MKLKTVYLGLAAVFALFAYFTIRLNPDGLNLTEQVGLYTFGVLSGVNIGLYLAARHRSGQSAAEGTV